jgi:Gram-negative bacterial TonB protein C-terminal/PilZ domain
LNRGVTRDKIEFRFFAQIAQEDTGMAESFSHGEKENSLGIAESRVHPRTEVRALAYIELSDENAGLILNISEDGLAVQAVQVVTSDHLPRMRFRLPKTDWTIEVAGRMVWQLRSRKEVGIQFVDLSDAARAHIQEWIVAEPSRLAAPPEAVRRRALQPEKFSRSGQVESKPAVSIPATEPEVPLEPVVFVAPSSILPSPAEPRVPAEEAALSISPAETSPHSEEFIRPPTTLPDVLPQPVLGSFPLGRMSVPDLRRAEPPPVRAAFSGVIPDRGPNMLAWKAPAAPAITRELKKPRRWWTYTAALGIIAALGFAALVMIDPDFVSRPRVATVSQAPDATAAPESPSPQQAAPTDGSGNAPGQQTPQRLPGVGNSGKASHGQSGVSQRTYSPLTSQAHPPAIINPLTPVNSLASHRDEASVAGTGAKSTQDQSDRQANGSLSTVQPSQTQILPPQTAAPAASSNLTPAPGSRPAAPRKDQDAYAASAKRDQDAVAAANQNKPPVQSSVVLPSAQGSPVVPSVPLSGVPSGSVGATSQFHAIRIPPELRAKGSQLGGNLQIGQMLSSYSPSYPIDAARQGVEGIVKLDAIVAADGTVESVQVLSGPAMLTGVSVSAVKQWRYGQTLLGEKPIGAEQYVTLVFRLAK